MCIGNEFATTKIMVFLHHLILNYEWLVVHPNEKNSYDPMPIFEKALPLKVHKKAQQLRTSVDGNANKVRWMFTQSTHGNSKAKTTT